LVEIFSKEVERVRDLIRIGDFREVNTITQNILSKDEIDNIEKNQLKILRGLNLDHFGRLEYKNEIFEEGLDLLDEAFEESKEIRDYNLMFDALFVQAPILKRLHMHERAIQTFENIQLIYEKIEQDSKELLKEKEASFLFLKHLYLYHKDVSQEDFSSSNVEFINLIEKALELFK
jgi:hypothetical protein